MIWKDLLYFSKGEKRALILLVSLIGVATGLLLWGGRPATGYEDREALEKEYGMVSGQLSFSGKSKSLKKDSLPARTAPAASPRKKRTSRVQDSKPDMPTAKKSASRYPKAVKYAPGTVVELNSADTVSLKKVPGIGSTFARRIVKFRRLLGGYASVSQLREVYGMDDERYAALAGWFRVDTALVRRLNVNRLPADSLRRHPYLNYRQAQLIEQLRQQKGRLTGWENLMLLDEFPPADWLRLAPYLSFE